MWKQIAFAIARGIVSVLLVFAGELNLISIRQLYRVASFVQVLSQFFDFAVDLAQSLPYITIGF